MYLNLNQNNFSHAKCMNCKHFGWIESFNPKLVDIDKSNVEHIKITFDEDKKGIIQIQTINMNCPICYSPNCESYYLDEMN